MVTYKCMDFKPERFHVSVQTPKRPVAILGLIQKGTNSETLSAIP